MGYPSKRCFEQCKYKIIIHRNDLLLIWMSDDGWKARKRIKLMRLSTPEWINPGYLIVFNVVINVSSSLVTVIKRLRRAVRSFNPTHHPQTKAFTNEPFIFGAIYKASIFFTAHQLCCIEGGEQWNVNVGPTNSERTVYSLRFSQPFYKNCVAGNTLLLTYRVTVTSLRWTCYFTLLTHCTQIRL